jgi:glycolate oxidase FAD binding subunit
MSPSVQASLTRIEEIVGSPHVVTDLEDLAARQVDHLRPSAIVRPADAAQTAEVVRFAAREKVALIPCGGGTKLGIGDPPERYELALDFSRMNRVLAYDPRDLTLGVEPGIPVENLLHTLSEQKQFLPLAAPFLDRATVGGVVAANSSSPLRHAYGGIRDYCLGMEFVTGDGVVSKAGGRVVKNVTGYDLHKLLIGSLGTLAVITRVNFRTFPLPPAQRTFVISFSDAERAFSFCQAVVESTLTPQIVEVADPRAARLLFDGAAAADMEPQPWSVAITAAGQPTVVERHAKELGRMASAASAIELVPLTDTDNSSVLTRIREFSRLILDASPAAAIFRIGILPAAVPSLLGRLSELAAQNHLNLATLTRASGIVFAAFLPQEANPAPHADLARAAHKVFQSCGEPEISASAMLEWCPLEVKRAVGDVWGTPRNDFALMQRVKNVFDPQNILSPGRFAGGI